METAISISCFSGLAGTLRDKGAVVRMADSRCVEPCHPLVPTRPRRVSFLRILSRWIEQPQADRFPEQ